VTGSSLAAAVAALRDFVLEPAPADATERVPPQRNGRHGAARPLEIFVAGVSARCGASTVARGLASFLSAPASPAAVWDVGATDPTQTARGRAGPVVLVAAGACEPALAELVAARLARRSPSVIVVANRVREPERWRASAAVCLPESRTGAAFAARGRRPPGRFGAALAGLADEVRGNGVR
jgi:hypothetical protein